MEPQNEEGVATVHVQALTENATRELRAVILTVADLMDEDETRTQAEYGAPQTIPVSMTERLILDALNRLHGDFGTTYVRLLRDGSREAAVAWSEARSDLGHQVFAALYPEGLRSRPLTADQVRVVANDPALIPPR
ncbi:hypothetical protein ACIQU7_23990 [Streptomyces albidoflavus]